MNEQTSMEFSDIGDVLDDLENHERIVVQDVRNMERRGSSWTVVDMTIAVKRARRNNDDDADPEADDA